MPTCDPAVITPICQHILALKPHSVLDIGVGNGKWGFLAREYTDVYLRRTQLTQIDGIEIHEPYITDVHRAIYDQLYIGDAVEVLVDLGQYGLILAVDVLEHLTKERGQVLLSLIEQQSEHALITTPVSFTKQGTVFGNVHEQHVSHWTESELSSWGNLKRLGRKWILEI